MTPITTTDALASFCDAVRGAPFIAVDTEFMRENTYYPELCLVQLADENEAAAIDPKAEGLDLTPMLELITNNEDVLKVFHAGGQDIEIFFNLSGRTPHPLFDTQIAAMALGQGEQIGYSNLVDLWLGIQLDKGARFTDWSRRPLDKRQIDYAVGDVTHLATLFPMMLEKLVKTGRGEWLNDEMERLADPDNYRNDPEMAWRRIKLQSRKADVLGRLKALGAWREREAQRKNIPRGRIMKDETMADIASHPPKAQAELPKVRGLSPAWRDNEIGARLMATIADAPPLPKSEMPDRGSNGPGGGKEEEDESEIVGGTGESNRCTPSGGGPHKCATMKTIGTSPATGQSDSECTDCSSRIKEPKGPRCIYLIYPKWK
jgi:ribonuclease D